MARKRTEMNKVKDILRLRFDAGLSLRGISKCCAVGPATISEILSRFSASGLTWQLTEQCSDADLENAGYKGRNAHSLQMFMMSGRSKHYQSMPMRLEDSALLRSNKLVSA